MIKPLAEQFYKANVEDLHLELRQLKRMMDHKPKTVPFQTFQRKLPCWISRQLQSRLIKTHLRSTNNYSMQPSIQLGSDFSAFSESEKPGSGQSCGCICPVILSCRIVLV